MKISKVSDDYRLSHVVKVSPSEDLSIRVFRCFSVMYDGDCDNKYIRMWAKKNYKKWGRIKLRIARFSEGEDWY